MWNSQSFASEPFKRSLLSQETGTNVFQSNDSVGGDTSRRAAGYWGVTVTQSEHPAGFSEIT